MDCNDTKTCMNEWARMCKTKKKEGAYCCRVCEMYNGVNKNACMIDMKENPERSIAIIQIWSDEHPLEIDWDKVPVDTPVMVRDDDKEKWIAAHFAFRLERRGYQFAVFQDGTTMSSKKDAFSVNYFKYCKLAVDPTPYYKEW